MAREIDKDTGEIKDVEKAQPALIPMSEDEQRKAGRSLAKKIRELSQLRLTHAEIRKEQKTAEEKLVNSIEGIAETIRTMGR
ncbi:MAG TPA: hypothetical protein VGR43_08535 [Dehalococcoidia bacterium]|jgi:hypothetical protein|nr:hypothetical protein [Dehalococcoidia bacterium]